MSSTNTFPRKLSGGNRQPRERRQQKRKDLFKLKLKRAGTVTQKR